MENQKDHWNTWVVCLGQVRLRESQQEERLVIDSCGSKLHKGIRYGKDFWFAVVDDFYYFQPSIHPFKIFIMPATYMDFVNFSIRISWNRCILQLSYYIYRTKTDTKCADLFNEIFDKHADFSGSQNRNLWHKLRSQLPLSPHVMW